MTLRPILLKAVALMLGGTGCAAWLADHRFALGFLLSGLLMVGSMGMGWWLTRSARVGNPSPAQALVGLKLLVVGAGIWTLLERFPVLAVVCGGSVLILAVVLDAAFQALPIPGSSLRKG